MQGRATEYDKRQDENGNLVNRDNVDEIMGAGVSTRHNRSQVVVPKKSLYATEEDHGLSSDRFEDSFESPPTSSSHAANQAAIYGNSPMVHFTVCGGTSAGASSGAFFKSTGDMCKIGSTKPSATSLHGGGSHVAKHVTSGQSDRSSGAQIHDKASVGSQTDGSLQRGGTGASNSYGPQMPSSWKKGDSLGSGSFGAVFLALNNDTGTPYLTFATSHLSSVTTGPLFSHDALYNMGACGHDEGGMPVNATCRTLIMRVSGELLAVKEVSILEGSKGRETIAQIEQEVRGDMMRCHAHDLISSLAR